MIMIVDAKETRVQNTLGDFFNFCGINVYSHEKRKCVCHMISNRNYLEYFPSGSFFDGIIIIAYHP